MSKCKGRKSSIMMKKTCSWSQSNNLSLNHRPDMNTHLFFDPNINVGTFREATLHGCPIAPLKSSNELSCYFCLSGIKVKAEISTTWGHQRKRDSLSSLRHSNEKRKKSSIATAVAATITARTQECAIGDEQCAAMCSASVHFAFAFA